MNHTLQMNQCHRLQVKGHSALTKAGVRWAAVMTLLLRQLRAGVLAHARIEASFAQIGPQLAGPSCLQLLRSFAAGTYLDKSQVTDRVLNVVKNFEKVDPSKVCAS